jgi:hypothetical protein
MWKKTPKNYGAALRRDVFAANYMFKGNNFETLITKYERKSHELKRFETS